MRCAARATTGTNKDFCAIRDDAPIATRDQDLGRKCVARRTQRNPTRCGRVFSIVGDGGFHATGSTWWERGEVYRPSDSPTFASVFVGPHQRETRSAERCASSFVRHLMKL